MIFPTPILTNAYPAVKTLMDFIYPNKGGRLLRRCAPRNDSNI
ncbi:hypothetical protein ES703_68982 [subsurface metagenome]